MTITMRMRNMTPARADAATATTMMVVVDDDESPLSPPPVIMVTAVVVVLTDGVTGRNKGQGKGHHGEWVKVIMVRS